mmetsp:Transcript_76611/g.177753  ORF Transcript_76611/g.177753 Transcript_76611/m.177753 type:complete len:203 (+) Transcript_76611:34-642(+)
MVLLAKRRAWHLALAPAVVLLVRQLLPDGRRAPTRPPATFAGQTGLRCRRSSTCGRRAESQAVLDALKEFDGEFKEPFHLLGIEDPEVPKTEIRSAFRKIARVEHPDVSEKPDAEERFRRISLAYELLMDDGGRAMLMEALERKVEDLEELETTKSDLDEQNEAWDQRWEEDEFSAVTRTIFIIALTVVLGYVIWFFGFEHD